MSFLLDTDICSLHLRGDRRVFTRFIQHLGQLHVSTIAAAELFVWAERSPIPVARRQKLLDFFQDVTIHAPDLAVAAKFGEVRARQLVVGQTTPEMDL